MTSELCVPHSLAPAPFPGCVVCGHRGGGTFAKHDPGWVCRWCLERFRKMTAWVDRTPFPAHGCGCESCESGYCCGWPR